MYKNIFAYKIILIKFIIKNLLYFVNNPFLKIKKQLI